MTTLKSLNLEYNPFKEITPSKDADSLIWAEMADVKTKLEKAYKDCITNNSKQIVLNWGPYGGGKTFSAYYFIKENKAKEGVTQIYLRCPKDGAKSTDELFKSIIDDLSFDKIHYQIKYLLNKHGEEKVLNFLVPKASREYAKAICLIGSEDDDIRDMMNRFLYVGLTKTELKKLGLAKDIQTDTDSIKFIAALLSCFIGDKTISNGRVVLWIDEMEDLIYYSPKHYKIFSQVLRDLFDSISDGFLTFMNFTLAENEESTIELILGGAVWSRINKKIRYKQFTEVNATIYCKELLNYSKINKDDIKPLDDSLINKMLEIIPDSNLTPREINKHFTSLLNFAIENEDKKIDANVFNSWLSEYAEDQG